MWAGHGGINACRRASLGFATVEAKHSLGQTLSNAMLVRGHLTK